MRKTEIHFFTIADYEEEEIWLREHHKNGWKLAKAIAPCFYVFDSCEPEDVIYRLDFKNSKQTEEYLQMLKDFGWEYFEQLLGWLYFRKPAEAVDSQADGELFSDNASKADMVGHIVKKRMLPLLVVFLCCEIPNFVRFFSREPVGGVWSFFTRFFSAMFVMYVFLLVYCGIKLKRIRDRYKNQR